MTSRYEVHVFKEYLKFSAAHFICYPGFREALHGHNYQVSVRIEGDLGSDGYVLDFGRVKAVVREICAELDEKVILPSKSECLRVAEKDATVIAVYEDDSTFSFPRADVVLLPIAHSSAEELAHYLLGRVREAMPDLVERGAAMLEVGVAEAPGQVAYCREAL
jgi:6-pyruvoyltetrahydropterin/6-carboxytetrahydropterin synthase